jgi:hypothetical protein
MIVPTGIETNRRVKDGHEERADVEIESLQLLERGVIVALLRHDIRGHRQIRHERQDRDAQIVLVFHRLVKKQCERELCMDAVTTTLYLSGHTLPSVSHSILPVSGTLHQTNGYPDIGLALCRYFELTITDYLKAVRLHAVHRELAATPASQDSVTAIALRHGYNHLGRFSLEFRERFGESPRKTLARRAGQKS